MKSGEPLYILLKTFYTFHKCLIILHWTILQRKQRNYVTLFSVQCQQCDFFWGFLMAHLWPQFTMQANKKCHGLVHISHPDISTHMGQNYQDGKYFLFVSLLSVFIVTWSQNEPSDSWEKSTQLTSTLWRIMALPCFYCKLAQFKTINN